MKITNDIFDAYLYCKYKAHLLQAGKKSVRHEYGAFLAHEHVTFKAAAKESLLRKLGLTSAPSKKHIRLPDLETGSPILFGGSISHDSRSFTYDALQRINGRSALGAFQYAPVLFVPDNSILVHHKHLLAFGAFVLKSIQSTIPHTGFVICGPNCRHTTVRLEKHNRSLPKILDELLSLLIADPPRLVLTKNCVMCQFQRQCKAQAIEEDNLSLLQRLINGQISERGLRDYLVLLSLQQTCRYKGTRFLEFLLSKEKDIDAFCERS